MQTIDFILNYAPVRHAVIAGIAAASVCSLLSVIVVLKRMAFVGQGVSHAGFGAAGFAFLFGFAGGSLLHDAVLYVFCMITAVLIGLLARRQRTNADTSIGVIMVAAMAGGVFLTDLAVAFANPQSDMFWPWYAQQVAGAARPDVTTLLFGSLLNTSVAQMWTTLGLAAVTALLFIALFKEILFFAFDEPTSRVFGVNTTFIHYLLLILLAVTVVFTMKLAGVLLVSAMLVIPGATALTLSDRLHKVFGLSCGVGVLGVLLGIVLSLELGFIGPGPCIVAVLCAMFGGAILVRRRSRTTAG